MAILRPLLLALIPLVSPGIAHARFIEHKERHLGPTGLFGVTSPTEIKITKVEEGSPADGRIKVGDIIVAAGDTAFKDQTRKQLADAIDRAETTQGKGILVLGLKDGRKVEVPLKVLDNYERTAWSWGYTNLVLGEYYLLTRDDHVLPALKAYSVAIASGRDAAGLWGHGMATLDLNRGQLHGRLPGYAVMNQSSLPCFISLLVADKAGIKHPEIQAGIAQTHGFYTDFIGRGTLPYGVHDPKPGSFNNNGMSGLAAVAFAIHGNKQGATFFSQMSAASHNTMESGHTGHYFNQMWTGLGANFAGPQVTAAFFKETRWLHTLNRRWDGNFIYDCSEYPDGEFSYRGRIDEQLGAALATLCPDPYAAGLAKDKDLFYRAVARLLDHRRAIGRTYGARLIARLPIEDFHHVGPRLRHLINDQDLTYHAYHNLGPQTESLTVLANLGVDGGVQAAFRILDSPLGKAGFKHRLLMAVLPKYGAAAKPYLPRLRAMADGGRFDKEWNAMIQTIEGAQGPAKATSFEEAMKAGLAN